jgi:ABC-type multidrug transport system fused ATPase/permease subunit
MKRKEDSLIFLLRKLWSNITKNHKVQLFFLLVIMIITSFSELLSMSAVIPFLGVLSSPEKIYNSHYLKPLLIFFAFDSPKDLLLPTTLIFIIAILWNSIMKHTLLWAQSRLSFSIGSDISYKMYFKTLFQPYNIHVSRNSSEIISAISNKSSSVILGILIPFLTILSSIFTFIVIIAALIAVSIKITFIALIIFGTVYLIVIFLTKKSLSQNSYNISIESNKVIKALQEGLGGIRDILIDGTQEIYCKIYKNADLKLRKSQSRVVIIATSPKYGIEAIGLILIAVLAYYLSIKDGLLSAIPTLGILALGAQRILPVMQQIYASWATIKASKASLQDVLVLLNQLMPSYLISNTTNKLFFNKKIELINIDFKYNNDSKYILKKINFSINKGSRVGIIGSTGTGKSTLLDIIMGLLEPTGGDIMIDDMQLNHNNTRSWQSKIAHVPQNIFLSDTTIAENIAFSVPKNEIDFQKLKEASEKAQINNFIESLPEKFNSSVGERGLRLSGGQRQRIGIARALYKKAEVIILDEATSALDYETENEVMTEVEYLQNDLTLIIVAHRLTTIKNCKPIFQLTEDGLFVFEDYNHLVKESNIVL